MSELKDLGLKLKPYWKKFDPKRPPESVVLAPGFRVSELNCDLAIISPPLGACPDIRYYYLPIEDTFLFSVILYSLDVSTMKFA